MQSRRSLTQFCARSVSSSLRIFTAASFRVESRAMRLTRGIGRHILLFQTKKSDAHHESAVTATVRFVKKIYARLTRTPGQVRIPESLTVTSTKVKSPTVRCCPDLMLPPGPEMSVRSHCRRCVELNSDSLPSNITHTGRWSPGNALCNIGLAV